MVVPMKKYTFLVHHARYEGFLAALGRLGVVHVAERTAVDHDAAGVDAGDPEPERHAARLARLARARAALAARRQAPTTAGTAAGAGLDTDILAAEIEALTAETERLAQSLAALDKEATAAGPWGDFDPHMAANLAGAGIRTRVFAVPAASLDTAWLERHAASVIGGDRTKTWVAVFDRGDAPVDPPIGEELVPPPRSRAARETERNALAVSRATAEARLDELARTAMPALDVAVATAGERLAFARARLAAGSAVDDRVRILVGWVPLPREAAVRRLLDERHVPALAEPPAPGDNPPVLLRNNFFSRLFEPIGKLYSLPAYFELDLVPLFAPFFTLFFGLCLGDGGYGLVLLVAATVARFRVKAEWKPLMTLGQVLGLSTTVVGALTGSAFGLSTGKVDGLSSLILVSDQQQLFNIALLVGLVQIHWGMLVKAWNEARLRGAMHGLAPFGRTLFFGGAIAWFIFREPLLLGLSGTGILLTLLFGNLQRPWYSRLPLNLLGYLNIFQYTNFFGDALSYIRLFALGISGGIIGLVINNIGAMFADIPGAGPVLAAAFIIAGHLGNLALGCLGAFVHPMRLTFVEFYNNAGFTGGGKPYTPLVLTAGTAQGEPS